MTRPKRVLTLPDDWVACDCAGCRRLLSGLACADRLLMLRWNTRRTYPPLVAGRVGGRPYCAACLAAATPAGEPAGTLLTEKTS